MQNVPHALEQFPVVRWGLPSSDEEAEIAGFSRRTAEVDREHQGLLDGNSLNNDSM
jgi:hypothetical protein